jgi:hypothetical protein
MLARAAASSNSTAVARSILVMTATSALLNIVGYFSGLSSPSLTESSTRRKSSPRSYDDGHTKLPTFSTNRKPSLLPIHRAHLHHCSLKDGKVFPCDLFDRSKASRQASGIIVCGQIAN